MHTKFKLSCRLLVDMGVIFLNVMASRGIKTSISVKNAWLNSQPKKTIQNSRPTKIRSNFSNALCSMSFENKGLVVVRAPPACSLHVGYRWENRALIDPREPASRWRRIAWTWAASPRWHMDRIHIWAGGRLERLGALDATLSAGADFFPLMQWYRALLGIREKPVGLVGLSVKTSRIATPQPMDHVGEQLRKTHSKSSLVSH